MVAVSARNFKRSIAVLLTAGTVLLTCIGCSSTQQFPDGLASIEQVARRQFGQLNPGRTQLRQQWDEWGAKHLKSGDIIFILGSSRVFMGLINFSKFSTEIAASPFSHVGIVSIEDGRPWVYDTVSGGPRRKELGWYLSRSSIQRVAFRRPRLELDDEIPNVIQFCQRVYEDRIPYDERLVWGNDRYYCSEFVEMAFREQGIPLCELMPINELPHFDSFPVALAAMIESTTSLSREQAVVFPGNDAYGIWSSPELMLLLSEQSPAQVPHPDSERIAAITGRSVD